MRTYNLIILAGGEDDSWCQDYGYTRKAMLPLMDKPMLDHVVESFRASKYINKIVVVGPKQLEKLASIRHVDKLIPESGSFIQNMLRAVFYMKRVFYKFTRDHDGYLVSFCDAAFLNTKVIDDTLENLSRHEADLTFHYIHKDTIAQSVFPEENRSYLPIGGEKYTGANLYYVRKFSALIPVVPDIVKMRKYRKDPHKFLKHIDCLGKDFPGIAETLSRKLGIRVDIHVSPHAEMGVDVDKPADYELAKIEYLRRAKAEDPGAVGTDAEIKEKLRKWKARYVDTRNE